MEIRRVEIRQNEKERIIHQEYRTNTIKAPNFNNEQRLSNDATFIIAYSIQSSLAEVAPLISHN